MGRICPKVRMAWEFFTAISKARKQLRTPRSYFDDTMKRIRPEDERNATKLGHRALLWVIYAETRLTVCQLAQALAMYSIRSNESAMLDADDIRIPSD
jgi:hypothetical protein